MGSEQSILSALTYGQSLHQDAALISFDRVNKILRLNPRSDFATILRRWCERLSEAVRQSPRAPIGISFPMANAAQSRARGYVFVSVGEQPGKSIDYVFKPAAPPGAPFTFRAEYDSQTIPGVGNLFMWVITMHYSVRTIRGHFDEYDIYIQGTNRLTEPQLQFALNGDYGQKPLELLDDFFFGSGDDLQLTLQSLDADRSAAVRVEERLGPLLESDMPGNARYSRAYALRLSAAVNNQSEIPDEVGKTFEHFIGTLHDVLPRDPNDLVPIRIKLPAEFLKQLESHWQERHFRGQVADYPDWRLLLFTPANFPLVLALYNGTLDTELEVWVDELVRNDSPKFRLEIRMQIRLEGVPHKRTALRLTIGNEGLVRYQYVTEKFDYDTDDGDTLNEIELSPNEFMAEMQQFQFYRGDQYVPSERSRQLVTTALPERVEPLRSVFDYMGPMESRPRPPSPVVEEKSQSPSFRRAEVLMNSQAFALERLAATDDIIWQNPDILESVRESIRNFTRGIEDVLHEHDRHGKPIDTPLWITIPGNPKPLEMRLVRSENEFTGDHNAEVVVFAEPIPNGTTLKFTRMELSRGAEEWSATVQDSAVTRQLAVLVFQHQVEFLVADSAGGEVAIGYDEFFAQLEAFAFSATRPSSLLETIATQVSSGLDSILGRRSRSEAPEPEEKSPPAQVRRIGPTPEEEEEEEDDDD